MNININFYDIIRYILLGAIIVIIAIISLHISFEPNISENGIIKTFFEFITSLYTTFKESIWCRLQDYNATIYIAILSLCFIIGVTAQAFRKYVAESRIGEKLVDLLANRCYLAAFFRPFFGQICYSCGQYCKIISNKKATQNIHTLIGYIYQSDLIFYWTYSQSILIIIRNSAQTELLNH